MKNKIIIGAVSIAMCTPAMADINKNASTATCDSSTIGATSGNAYMDTAWTANTINLDWYNGDTKQTSTTCQYDGAITLPNTPEVPTGYTFGGWKLRAAAAPSQPQQTTFDLSTLAQYINTDGMRHLSKSFGGDNCYYYEDNGINIQSDTCEEDVFSNLDINEFSVEFNYGTIKGHAICSIVGSEYSFGQTGSPTDNSGTPSAKYCWCQVTGFDAEKDGTYLNISSPLWVYEGKHDGKNTILCIDRCADLCSGYLHTDSDFRRALYGITQ